MHERIVEGRVDVSNAEHKFTFADLRAKRDGSFLLDNLSFLWRLYEDSYDRLDGLQ
jgi:hypothetical protein